MKLDNQKCDGGWQEKTFVQSGGFSSPLGRCTKAITGCMSLFTMVFILLLHEPVLSGASDGAGRFLISLFSLFLPDATTPQQEVLVTRRLFSCANTHSSTTEAD